MLDNNILLKTRKTLSVLFKQARVMLRDINITPAYLANYNYSARCYYMYDWTTQRIGISFVIKTYALHHVSCEIYYELNLLDNTLLTRSRVTSTAKPDAIARLAYNWRIALVPCTIINALLIRIFCFTLNYSQIPAQLMQRRNAICDFNLQKARFPAFRKLI